MKPKKTKTRNAGFTLVELLIVISIVAVLCAFALIGYKKAQSAADKAVTMGTLHQLQLASASYAADHNGKFVAASGKDEGGKLTQQWHRNRDFLDNLTGDINSSDQSVAADSFPKDRLDRRAKRLRSVNWDKIQGNFGAFEKDPSNSTWGSNVAWESSFSLAQLTNPGRTASFATALDWRVKYGGRKNYTGAETSNGQGKIAYRHDGKALVAFYDGHVEAISKQDMDLIDKNGGDKHPFWRGDQ
ncbi:type II secretion system protein [Akkermansiaceae bacterium]|nr:type II secretion system protein [Akkermansiaceae bacterium]